MVDLIIFVVLLIVGYVFGQAIDQTHYRSIRKRESLLRNIPLIASRKLPASFEPCKTELVTGNVVISVDFYKKFVAGLRNLVGGRVRSYESLIDRARREALLRMTEKAKALGANYVFNVKMETSSIPSGRGDGVSAVDVLAYGTAVILERQAPLIQKVEAPSPGMMNLRPR
ncbi:MAG: hypothetical protein HW411_583 [Gammaproteobacteria bacterium]|nr:hypothetical protein [Gammaproteobacteria bacterium]